MKECMLVGNNGDMCRKSESCFLREALDLEPKSVKTPEDKKALQSFEHGVVRSSIGQCPNWIDVLSEVNRRIRQSPQPSLKG